MKLSQLLAAIPPGNPYSIAGAGAETDAEISGVCYDSRRVGPGSLFVAVWHPGYGADGHDFVTGAVQAGAAAVVVQRAVTFPPGTPPVPVVQVRHTPSALGWLAAAFYGFPASRLGLVGVTGTDGKTTTCTLTTAILEAGGLSTGMVTTVASKSTGAVRANQAHTSTPEAVEIQALLAETLAGGGTHAVLETTSHALHQDRLAGCEFDVAVVTRVTHEHLEYHGSYEAYLDAKGKLLDLLRPDPQHPKRGVTAKAAVLNADDQASYGTLRARAPVPVVSYALRAEGAQVRALDVRSDGWSSRARLVSAWGEGELLVPIPGAFNVYNALAALTAGCSLGVPLEVALAALAQQRGVSGRMERIEAGQPFTVVVDFAHTPDSLSEVLRFLRRQTSGKLLCVFGSAGERDREKRPLMGRIAARQADYFILTDEDPRREDRQQILAEIAAGATAGGAMQGRHFECIADRGEAIRAALRRAGAGDTVLLAGKGHEQSIIGAVDGRLHVQPWDERQVARESLRELGYG